MREGKEGKYGNLLRTAPIVQLGHHAKSPYLLQYKEALWGWFISE